MFYRLKSDRTLQIIVGAAFGLGLGIGFIAGALIF